MGKEAADQHELIGLAQREDPWQGGRRPRTGERSPRRSHTSPAAGREAPAVTLRQRSQRPAALPSLAPRPALLTGAGPPCAGPTGSGRVHCTAPLANCPGGTCPADRTETPPSPPPDVTSGRARRDATPRRRRDLAQRLGAGPRIKRPTECEN